MNNTIVLVGRVTHETKLENKNEGLRFAKINIAVNRSYKNEEGIYETDFIPCILIGAIAEKASEYLEKGDLVGIKGRLETRNKELVVIADRVTFLSSRRNEE